MVTETASPKKIHVPVTAFRLFRSPLILFVILSTLIILMVGIWLRWHLLELPFDRDSYDEGVYWQSLRAMGSGHVLYQQIFYSQPPFFLLTIFPFYQWLGQNLIAAREGIALISLLGLGGAFLLGKAVRNWPGALFALLLCALAPLYLVESQTLQAEAPSVAFSFLSVGSAYLWWNHPHGKRGIVVASLALFTLVLGILCKLLAVSAVVPIVMIALMQLWRSAQTHSPTLKQLGLTLLIASCLCLFTCIVILWPFRDSFPTLWRSVITFHTDARQLFTGSQSKNLTTIKQFLWTPLTFVAIFSCGVAFLKRDWQILPLLGWFIATLAMLWQQAPLFPHHMVALLPSMISLAIFSLPSPFWREGSSNHQRKLLAIISLCLLLLMTIYNLLAIQTYYHQEAAQAHSQKTAKDLKIAEDLRGLLQPGQLIITDAQFIAGLADQSTPAALVDTSLVRIQTGYVSNEQLIHEAEQPQVRMVLFYTGRLSTEEGFVKWVDEHFQLTKDYGNGRMLWTKIA
ncbi:glycosyltransferase family 39 protein [Tengunoibacter tsumagoiensis]|nr:glycosyltransferase family 39 protein [Tengunoibacter tsumagoiensis]